MRKRPRGREFDAYGRDDQGRIVVAERKFAHIGTALWRYGPHAADGYAYNAFGRLAAVRRMELDCDGRPTRFLEFDPDFSRRWIIERYEHDGSGRVTSIVTDAGDTASDAREPTGRFDLTYDDRGALLLITGTSSAGRFEAYRRTSPDEVDRIGKDLAPRLAKELAAQVAELSSGQRPRAIALLYSTDQPSLPLTALILLKTAESAAESGRDITTWPRSATEEVSLSRSESAGDARLFDQEMLLRDSHDSVRRLLLEVARQTRDALATVEREELVAFVTTPEGRVLDCS